MNPDEIKRLVEQIYLEKGIDKETVFQCIEEALMTVAKRHGSGSDDSEYKISIERQTGEIFAYRDNVPITTAEITERAGAQSARQSISQKIREAVRDSIYNRYVDRLNNKQELVTGVVRRVERGGVVVIIDDKQEAWLPNSNKIRGEIYRNENVYDFVIESVEKAGMKARIVLSRKSKLLLRRLFERECPEITDGTVEIVEISRDPGFRAKIAVRSNDSRVDPLGVCLGVRNSRSMRVSKALNGERIDVVLWSDSTSEFIQNALSPAKVDEVILCPRLDRAIVMVHPDQRSLAIGKRGQNVNLAKKLLGGWELEILTHDDNGQDELAEMLDRATVEFGKIEGLTPEIADILVGEGFTSYYDLSCIEPEDFMEITGATQELTTSILEKAEQLAEEQEKEAEERRKEELHNRSLEELRGAGGRRQNDLRGPRKFDAGEDL